MTKKEVPIRPVTGRQLRARHGSRDLAPLVIGGRHLLTRQRPQSGLDNDGLLARAIELSDRYLVGARPQSVRWVTNQTARWGSCSYYSGQIRLSHRLRVVPGWVLDSVLVHEVAHLTHPDHSPAFHKLAGAYPRHEEAGVFLAGYGLGLANPTSAAGPD